MAVEIRADPPGELSSLHAWLAGEEDLRGRIKAQHRPAQSEAGEPLGPVLDALVVALGPGGAATAFSAAVITWLRNRPQRKVHLEIDLPDKRKVTLSTSNVTGLDAEALHQVIDTLAAETRPEPPAIDRDPPQP